MSDPKPTLTAVTHETRCGACGHRWLDWSGDFTHDIDGGGVLRCATCEETEGECRLISDLRTALDETLACLDCLGNGCGICGVHLPMLKDGRRALEGGKP